MIAKTRLLSGSLLTRILVVEALTIVAACIALPLLARGMLTNSVTRIENDLLLGQAETVARGLSHASGSAPGAGWHVDLGEALRPIYANASRPGLWLASGCRSKSIERACGWW